MTSMLTICGTAACRAAVRHGPTCLPAAGASAPARTALSVDLSRPADAVMDTLVKYGRNGLRSPRHSRMVVLAHQRRHGGRDLRLRHPRHVAALTQGRGIGSDHRNPDILRP